MSLTDLREAKANALQAEHDLEDAQVAYLRECGWLPTSDTPGAIWMWERKLPDERIVIAADLEAAVMTELNIERSNARI